MSIRARIALLAFVAIFSVVAALFAQYRSIHAEVEVLRAQKSDYIRAQAKSALVHILQKERGLSAAMLANPTPDRGAELRAQYAETDLFLAQMPALEMREKLQIVRKQIANRSIVWPEVREFYTAHIRHALDMISESAMTEKSSNTAMHAAILELAFARENMGLIRATINGIYSRGSDGLEDVTYLAAEYGKFKDHLQVFQRNLNAQRPVRATEDLLVAPYAAVVGQIEKILRHGPQTNLHQSNRVWWGEATRVIDNFKRLEDDLYSGLLQSADRSIAGKEKELGQYGLIAVGLGLLVALLTALTIVRILRALGVLITTLDDVVRCENYSIRINGESPKDEFGRISLSLNNLLDFTDTLISDKEKLASTDLLTGVLNRRSFLEAVKREAARADRYASHFALVFIDIDNFKLVNDRFGHATGDETLVRLVHVLQSGLRSADLLARWGGEEFVILAPQTSLEQGYQFAEKLCAEVSHSSFHGVGKITCSMGVAEWRAGETFDSLCQRADTALYRAKETGRNRVCKAD
jgi:diguanylate cyclase (GGDEF)-like protein